MIQFIRDLALLPAILRHAAAAERNRRYWASPEGQERSFRISKGLAECAIRGLRPAGSEAPEPAAGAAP